ncbi:Cell wall-active antibiotics response 4TMS YvqF [bacterium A37T11]|nr:Cell wall-active antibiotics response 4TMS YvqF [bacterium A37T11]
MESDKNRLSYKSNSSRVWTGIFIIFIGALILVKQLNIFIYFPEWIFSWPIFMIIIGLIIGGRTNFKKPASFILLGIGIFCLLSNYTNFSIGRLFWPILIIVMGSWLIFGRSHHRNLPNSGGDGSTKNFYSKKYDWDKRVNINTADNDRPIGEPRDGKKHSVPGEENPDINQPINTAEYIDSVSIFGNVKKNVISNNFKGGEIVNIMGGAEINLMHADIQGPVVLEVVQIFGGTKIIIPAHWNVHPEMAAVFGGVEDQRFTFNVIPDDTRILYIKGTSIFGGITIKSV